MAETSKFNFYVYFYNVSVVIRRTINQFNEKNWKTRRITY